jgi:type VI secretion system protein
MKQIHAAKPFVKSLNISSTTETNNNMPVALDLVIVGHPVLARKINTMTAAQFFKEKRQLKQDHPKHIKIRSFELIPGHPIPEFSIPYPRKDVSAAFIFARFQNNFPNRWRLLPADTVRIFIREQHVEILSENDDTPASQAKIPVAKPATPLEDTIVL